MPKFIHLIALVGPNPRKDILADLEKCLKAWEGHSDGYEIKVHKDGSDLDPRLKDTWERYPKPVIRSDFLRYSVLKKYGGWYFDLDCRPQKPLSEIEALIPKEKDKLFLTWIMFKSHVMNSDILFAEKDAAALDTIIEYQAAIDVERPSITMFACAMFMFLRRKNIFTLGDRRRFSSGTGSRVADLWIIRNGDYLLDPNYVAPKVKKLETPGCGGCG